MKYTLLLLTVALFHQVCFSQHYEVNSVDLEKSISRGATYEGFDNDGYVYASSYRSFNFILFSVFRNWVKVINPNIGSMVAEKNIEKLVSKRGYRYVDFLVLGEKPIVVVTKKGTVRDENYYAFELDRNLSLLKNAYKIGEKPTCMGFSSGSGKGFVKGVLININRQNRMTTFVSDLSCSNDEAKQLMAVTLNENNNVIHDYKFEIDLEGTLSKQKIFTYRDKVYFYTLETTREKVSGKLFKRDVNTAHLFAINSFGEVMEIDLEIGPNFVASEISLVQSGDKVLVSGQLVEAGTSKLIGIFTAELNTIDETFDHIEKQFFDKDFITKFWSDRDLDRAERKNDEPMLNANFVLADKFNTDDDGAIYLFQKREVQRVTRSSRTAAGGYTTTVYYYYYYTDVIACKVDANAQIAWVELLPLYQLTIDYDIGPSFIAAQKGGDLYLIHSASKEQIQKINDGEHNNERTQFRDRSQSHTAVTRIDTEGVVTSQAVIDNNETRTTFSPAAVANNKEEHKFLLLGQQRKLFGSAKHITINSVSY